MRFTEERGQALRELLNDYSLVKGRLYIRIRNRERHVDELEELACREFLEFAITCHIDVSDFIHGASVAVTKKMADSYGITEAQLFEDALENAQKIRPAKVEEADKMMESITGHCPWGDEGRPEGYEDTLTILTTEGVCNGAAVILYPGVLENLAQKAGGSLLLIPSSVHEFLCMADSKGMAEGELEELIREVNCTTVSPEEVLSDRLYRYDPEKGEIILA